MTRASSTPPPPGPRRARSSRREPGEPPRPSLGACAHTGAHLAPLSSIRRLENALTVATAPPKGPTFKTQEEVTAYIAKHGLEAKIQAAVSAAVKAGSEDPMADIVAALQKA